MDESINFNDVQNLDTDLYKYLTQVKNTNMNECDLEFKYTSQSLGRNIEVVLKKNSARGEGGGGEEGGEEKEIQVTNENRDDFVEQCELLFFECFRHLFLYVLCA